MIGFARNPNETHRRAVYHPGTGYKAGYLAHTNKGVAFQDATGKTVARVLRFKNGHAPYTDSHPCGGSDVPFPRDERFGL